MKAVELGPRLSAPVLSEALAFSKWVGELVRRHRRALVWVALKEGLVAEEALDAVQDAFATFVRREEWRAIARDEAEAPKLLVTLVRNHARNARRRFERSAEPLSALSAEAEVDHARELLDAQLVRAEEHFQLTGCVATLDAQQRAIVTARLFEGASGAQVAFDLGISPGHVAVLLHRARQRLRTCLAWSRRQRTHKREETPVG